ncbi:MAG: thioredoxin domain-containing protein [Cyanobacteria bacterium P01_C01_bin.72]
MPIPIPSRPSGYRLGQSDAPVQIEMFFDLECPFSKKGWQNIMTVVSAYSASQISLILQPMTLGNHRQSWDATKAAIAVAGDDADKFVSFVSYLLDHQTEFANEASKDRTQTEWQQMLAEYALEATELSDKEQFIQLLNDKEVYNKARIPARFAAIRGVWSTPTFFINGAEASNLSSQSSLADWQAQIDSLL